jgi:hypothetical protein
MRERHWRCVMAITGRELSMAEDAFKLQHLLECGLLAHRRGRARRATFLPACAAVCGAPLAPAVVHSSNTHFPPTPTRCREEVEEVANGAVKEEQIETKLAAIESDWAVFNLVRTRAPPAPCALPRVRSLQ